MSSDAPDSFKYLGQSFKAVRNFRSGEMRTAMGHLTSIGISNYKDKNNSISDKWDYLEFYSMAPIKRDIYLMNETILVVPWDNELFKYKTL